MDRPEELRRRIAALGFDEVRYAAAGPVPAGGLRDWLAAGHQAGMRWMDRTADKRLAPELVLSGVRSIVALGVSTGSVVAGVPGRPRFARYAMYSDYHDTIGRGLAAAGKILEELYGVGSADYRAYVDTGPVLERAWAERAGIGFVGKNAMLISRGHGNALLLAAILTRVELPPDPPLRAWSGGLRKTVGLLCGKCSRCLDACPTRAFPAPGVVDARRCISYQTIENRGVVPRELRPGIGERVFGCDVCLEVCPWNRFAQAGRQMLLSARPEIGSLSWAELLEMTSEAFSAKFRRTPVKRLKYAGFLRNACIAAGNSGDASLLPRLAQLAAHELPLVRLHAAWAVYRLAGAGAAELLRHARSVETDPAVLEEYALSSAAPDDEEGRKTSDLRI
jgi:epoxyqueuosine reductase